jgi:hypothetical protein
MISAFTGFLNRILSVVLAVFFILLVLKPGLFGAGGAEGGDPDLLSRLLEHQVLLILAAAVLLVLNLHVLQFATYILWNSQVRRYIASKTTSGTARVSLDALERALNAAAQDMPEVSRCRLRVYRTAAKRYKVDVHFWIPDTENVINISEKLRLVLKKRFSELVSIEPDDRVFFEISLAGIKGRTRSRGYSSSGPPRDGIDASRGHFKGPIYPVDGDV